MCITFHKPPHLPLQVVKLIPPNTELKVFFDETDLESRIASPQTVIHSQTSAFDPISEYIFKIIYVNAKKLHVLLHCRHCKFQFSTKRVLTNTQANGYHQMDYLFEMRSKLFPTRA